MVYPILQWGIGGWLLAPPKDDNLDLEENISLSSNLNHNPDVNRYTRSFSQNSIDDSNGIAPSESHILARYSVDKKEATSAKLLANDQLAIPTEEPSKLIDMYATLKEIVIMAISPPVVASLAGLFVSLFPPVRSVFVDLNDRDGDAPLEWWFDAIYNIGQAAIPVNMFMLGGNLMKSLTAKKKEEGDAADANALPLRCNIGIVVGKLILMPAIGVATVVLLRRYILNIPEDIDASFYLVVMMVFCCPTANTVIVMAELGGQAKEMLAKSIFIQYLCAPLFLTISVSVMVSITQNW